MFTGIVQSVGHIVSIRETQRDRDIVVENRDMAEQLFLGASVALDGVCQTVTELDGPRFTVHAIEETLRVTTLGERREGDALNLEPPVAAGQAMGGHFVQGHVDGVATVLETKPMGESVRWRFSAATELVAQMVPKGSVALDGISLTLGPWLEEDRFEVFIIPHTTEVTTLASKRAEDRVNLETDILGKYLWRFLQRKDHAGGTLDWDTIRRTGFDD